MKLIYDYSTYFESTIFFLLISKNIFDISHKNFDRLLKIFIVANNSFIF